MKKTFSHEGSARARGSFYYNDWLVIGYELACAVGDSTTVFSFLSDQYAQHFASDAAANKRLKYVVNGSQVVCFSDYNNAMKHIPREKLEFLSFSYSDI